MPLSDFHLIAIGLIGILILAVGVVVVSTRLQQQRLQALEERNREQALALQAAEAASLVLWAEDQGGLVRLPPTSLLNSLGMDGLLTLPGMTVKQFLAKLPPSVSADIQEALHGFAPGSDGPIVRRVSLMDTSGKESQTEWTIRNHHGRLQGVIRDITSEVRLQEQLIQSQRREAVGTLVSGISHEFGNVLAAVDSCSQALLMQELGADARKAGELIQGSAKRGKAIIRQLLDLGSQRPSETQAVDVNAVLGELKTLLEPLIPRRIRLRLELEEALPRPSLDRAQLHQALLNLCLNARDAMPEGGTLTLRSRREGEGISIHVEDTGCGMDDAIRARIFDPFFTTKEPGQGTGLGLSITKEIVEKTGGRLECLSEVGKGSSFKLRL